MKGIIMAGGLGSRLYPSTLGISKQLIPIYNKPMIYYSLSVLMLAGIRDVLIITTPEDINNYQRLLKQGQNFGINIQYCIQHNPAGIAQAFILGEKFIANDSVCLVLGDNIFYGQGFSPKLLKAATLTNGAKLFGYEVNDPERFGVVEFNHHKKVLSIEEKPSKPKSNYAVTGLYFYDNNVVDVAKTIKPSSRGELEITSINNVYLTKKNLSLELLGRGFAWLDTGTNNSLLEAAQFVQTIEHRQGFKIACLEEIAFNNGWLSKKQLIDIIKPLANSEYGHYLQSLLSADREKSNE